MIGDGYTSVMHCERLDLIGEGFESDAEPLQCDDSRLPQHIKDELLREESDDSIDS